jgi:hypothetical protein
MTRPYYHHIPSSLDEWLCSSASIVIIQKAVERVYTCKMLPKRWSLDISADKQYKLICEEGSF